MKNCLKISKTWILRFSETLSFSGTIQSFSENPSLRDYVFSENPTGVGWNLLRNLINVCMDFLSEALSISHHCGVLSQ